MDQRHQLLFVFHEALNFIRPRKLTQLLTAWKISSHPMACVTKTMKGGWRLRFQALLEAIDNSPIPLKE
jgi:hypothetical protein